MSMKTRHGSRPTVSVLMAVYKNDRPDWLRLAINSVLEQTYRADEVVVVVDGPVSHAIQQVLMDYGDQLTVLRLKKNQGLWKALNQGLAIARGELIARMDADDIALPDRLEKQVAQFRLNPALDLVGGQIAEFENDIDNIIAYRRVPLKQEAIVNFARFRSPFNHPTVMYKKTSVAAVGGYHNLQRTEDYDLWIRMLQSGARCINIDDVILYYRVSQANVHRRTNQINYREMKQLYYRSYKSGVINCFEYVFVRLVRWSFYYAPDFMKYGLYKRFLRHEQ